MYLYLGQDTVVRTQDIIGIFDPDNTTVSKITRNTLRKNEKKGNIVAVGTEIPKAFVICAKDRSAQKIYFSPVTTTTLTRRAQSAEQGEI